MEHDTIADMMKAAEQRAELATHYPDPKHVIACLSADVRSLVAALRDARRELNRHKVYVSIAQTERDLLAEHARAAEAAKAFGVAG